MMIPNFIDVKVVDTTTGKFTSEWGVIMQQLITQLQTNASDQGLVAPSQSNANMIIIQDATVTFKYAPAGYAQIAPPGTLLFNTDTVNGGSSMAPNGQLYVKLQDGTFHPVTNT
jgi:hypothetical protein